MPHPLFGPAGNSDSFTRQYKSSVYAPAWLKAQGLDCYEYQCGRGVHIGEDTARAIGRAAREAGIVTSLHAPYFINLSGADPARVEKNVEYILASARVCRWLEGDRIVVHCGGLSGMEREQALQNTLLNLRQALAALEQAGLSQVRLCVETMGKINVLGDAGEVIRICQADERLLPCIDFGHLYARSLGVLDGPEEMRRMLDRVVEVLGEERASRFHSHFSHIEFTPKGGELRHLCFSDEGWGPEFAPLAAEVARRGWSPTFICESAGTQSEDALTMKEQYLQEEKES